MTISFENGLQSGNILTRYCCNDIVSLKTQTFENDATTTTNYSNYLDA